MRDFLLAIRQLRQNRGFTAAAILSLALGIGANAAIFGLLNALILRPLPVPQADRLVAIGGLDPARAMLSAVPGAVVESLRKNPLLDGVCGILTPLSTIEVHGNMRAAPAHALSGDCYRTLGIQPILGRLITPADDLPNGPRVVVLGYDFWQREFGGQASVLGQTIRIEGVPSTVIGATPPTFKGMLLGFPPLVSFPITQQINPEQAGKDHPEHAFYWASVFARMKPGVTTQQLQAQLRVSWTARMDEALSADLSDRAALLKRPVVVRDGSTGLDYVLRERFRGPLWGLLVISGVVLLAGCLNVANLQLANGLKRRKEMALRVALGAPLWKLMRQMAMESLLLVVAGAGAGVLVGYAADRALLSVFRVISSEFDLSAAPDARAMLFAAVTALISLLVFGLLPAWQSSDVDSASALKEAARTMSGTRSKMRQVLLAGQVALTLVLICTASLFLETVRQLRDAPLGIQTKGVLNVQLMALPGGHKGNVDGAVLSRDLMARVGALPQVEAVALTSSLPFYRNVSTETVKPLGTHESVSANYGYVGDRFLSVMRIPLLRGRDFNESGTPGMTAILSESAARVLFPDRDPIGQRVSVGPYQESRDVEIVGVAADTGLAGPRAANPRFVYLNLWQHPANLKWPALVLKFHGDPSPLAMGIRQAVREGGHDYAERISTVAGDRDLSLLQERIAAWLATAFGVLALLLAAVGLYGLLSYSVRGRTAEIGVRMALGARQKDVRWLVMREALLILATGLLVGLPLVYIGLRALSSLLYGVGKLALGPVGLSVLVLALVSALAAWIPARRATAVDPMMALRTE